MSDFLTALKSLSSAEDFLQFLQIEYDPRVVQVNRLHILKRFHDYLDQASLSGMPDDNALKVYYTNALERAYQDFTHSNGVTEKVFPVFHRQRDCFVPLSSLIKD